MPASIFAGSKVKTLKSTLSLNGGADIISSSTTNPQTSAVSAEPGSLLLNTTSGTMYRKLDAGLTTNWVEVGAGSGGKNYIKNPDFDGGATTSWSMQKVSLSSLVPTGNIGAADAGHTIAASSSSPLEGANSLLVQGASAFTAGNCLVSAAFAIDREDIAKVLGWSFYYEAVTTNMDFSGTSAGTWAVYIAEVTTATPDTVVSWIQPAGVYNLVQGSGVGIASGTFQTTATGTAYRLVLVCINGEAAATTIKVDDFQLGPQKVLQGPSGPVGEIIATGSLTPPVGFLYCNGSAVSRSQYSDLFKEIGTTYGVGDGSTTFNLPDLRGIFARGAGSQTISGITFAATLGTKQVDTFQGHKHIGPVGITGGSPTNPGNNINVQYANGSTGATQWDGTGNNTYYNDSVNSPGRGPSVGSETRPANVAVAYHIRYLATYQMSSDTDTRVISAQAACSTAFAYSAATPINFDSVITDRSGSVSPSPTAWKYTAPVSGDYRVSITLLNSVGAVSVNLFKNGSLFRQMMSVTTAAITSSSTTITLNAGDYIDMRGSGAATLVAGSVINTISIERLSGPATIAASETVAMRRNSSSGQTINSAVTSIVNFETAGFDTHSAWRSASGAYNAATGTWATTNPGFVAPVSGVYLVAGCIGFDAASAFFTTVAYNTIRVNGTSIFSSSDFFTANGTIKISSFSGLVRCLAGDVIDVVCRQETGAARNLQPYTSDRTCLTIVRVGN